MSWMHSVLDGYGTFDELFETLALVQTRKIKPVPVILVGKEYWRQAFNADFLVGEGVIEPEDQELFWYAESTPAQSSADQCSSATAVA